ncbi:type 2 periplasmic-binding domain-containing protein [Fulvivirga sediminis]|uniref:Uracil-DNA glycosylase n=1 Tax=Fulvivirga sediminis TaxID=2803949 RepID=A0A937FAL9_9BACT|nr:uracil-DNA glycosylase [Fulvivirga sediminis]MBL3657073.1 uracil-DNA glycosylase [Fulvivirga sediminis]
MLRVGGVPEHFNLPIHLAMERGDFVKADIDIEWTDFPGGTGAMNAALRNDECDICILLTEGVIIDIINGNPSKIISPYVISPLIWGVHTGQHSDVNSYEQVFERNIAISRFGSGSHLMPTVDALSKGKKMSAEQFIPVQDINGALKSLNRGEADIFYWEKYTTKPYVSQGYLRRIGEFISPWPCFMIAATNKAIAEKATELDSFLKIVHQSCEDFMKREDAIELTSQRYKIPLSDAQYWYHATEWATDGWVSDKMLNSVLFTLKEAGIAAESAAISEVIWVRK